MIRLARGGSAAGAAVTIRYLSDDEHRLRMLRYVDDEQVAVAVPITQGIGHLSSYELSGKVLRTLLGANFSVRERAKLYTLGMTGSPDLESIRRSPRSPSWQKTAARWWQAQGSTVTS